MTKYLGLTLKQTGSRKLDLAEVQGSEESINLDGQVDWSEWVTMDAIKGKQDILSGLMNHDPWRPDSV